MNDIKGPKYESTSTLGLTDLAKLMREDIREATRDGKLPRGLKVSVTTSRYSMGQSIDIRIVEAPFVTRVPEHEVDDNRAQGIKWPWLTRDAAGVLETLEEIHGAYNRDRSDMQSDYYSVRYSGSVSFAIRESRTRITPKRTAKAILAKESHATLYTSDRAIAAFLTSCRMFAGVTGVA